MMKFRLSFLLLLSFIAPCIYAQTVDVPTSMEFAGIKLKINSDARELIAKNVWSLRKNSAYYNTTLERVDLYFPIIERVLREENLPDDFKYLAVQESSLVSDAVSSSNAVGYWQFKQASALEVGLRVDNDVDERKHIASATRGAAKYIKRNNFYLNNWLSSLLSYYAGLTGARSVVPTDWTNASKITIDKDTHWYLLKFLAHKIAFQESIGRNSQRSLVLLEYGDCNGKSIKQIARDLEVDAAELERFNKWLSDSRVPEDKNYSMIIPAPASQLAELIAKTGASPGAATPVVLASTPAQAAPRRTSGGAIFPILKQKKGSSQLYTVNGKPGIQARPGDNVSRLAQLGEVSVEKFLRYNDMSSNDKVVPGQAYYLRKKKSKAQVHEHVAVEGESLWQISQQYGITMHALMRKNRMKNIEKLKHGRVVWLRYIRPSDTPVEILDIPKPAVIVAQNKPATEPKKILVASEKPSPTPVRTPVEKKDSAKAVATTPIPPRLTPTEIEEKEPKPIEQKAIYVPTPTKKAAVADTKVHVVEQGQTLYGISKLYNITVNELRTWNSLSQTDGVKMGQELVIEQAKPFATTASTTATTSSSNDFIEHTVQAGDTVYKLSRTYGVSVQQILEWNGKSDNALSLGEKVKVKKGK